MNALQEPPATPDTMVLPIMKLRPNRGILGKYDSLQTARQIIARSTSVSIEIQGDFSKIIKQKSRGRVNHPAWDDSLWEAGRPLYDEKADITMVRVYRRIDDNFLRNQLAG